LKKSILIVNRHGLMGARKGKGRGYLTLEKAKICNQVGECAMLFGTSYPIQMCGIPSINYIVRLFSVKIGGIIQRKESAEREKKDERPLPPHHCTQTSRRR